MINPFANLSVDSVLKLFNKAIARLEKIENANRIQVEKLADQVEAIEIKRHDAQQEAIRAGDVAAKIKKLIS